MNLSKFTVEQKQQMYDLYEQGYSKTRIAQMLGLSREACRLIINQYIVDKIKTEDIYSVLHDYTFLVTEGDLGKLQVDYWKNPLKRGDKPKKEDLNYLYIILNLPLSFLASYFRTTTTTVQNWCRFYHIQKSKSLAYALTKKLNMQRYGVENTTQLTSVKDKMKQTNLRKYGVDNYAKTVEYKEKYRQTCLYKYGVTNATKLASVREKMINTSMERYGVPNITMTEANKQKLRANASIMLQKMRRTNRLKYNFDYSLQNPVIKAKAENTCLLKYGNIHPTCLEEIQQKQRQTTQQRFGVPYASQSPAIKEKQRQTCMERYGVGSYAQSNEFRERLSKILLKRENTKRLNKTYGRSADEELIYKLLSDYFGYTRVLRQYHSVVYPFACDFYVCSLDLYIEYQGYWTHGDAPFDGHNLNHIKRLDCWKQRQQIKDYSNKRRNSYNNAVHVWTQRDPLKRETAKKNNLNWIEFFNMQEFYAWFNSLSGDC